MAKYFITYQPFNVADQLCKKDYFPTDTNYTQIKKEFGYNPIFLYH